jgi:hypothetical protein
MTLLNLALAVLGIVMWRFVAKLDLPDLIAFAVCVVLVIVFVNIGYRLFTGRWLDGVVRLGPPPIRRRR